MENCTVIESIVGECGGVPTTGIPVLNFGGLKLPLFLAMSLLKQYSEKITESTAVVETVSVTVKNVLAIKDQRKLMLETDKGTFFVWKDSIKGIKNPDTLPKKFTAEVTLIQKGAYINVTKVTVELESLGKYNFVASCNLAVAL